MNVVRFLLVLSIGILQGHAFFGGSLVNSCSWEHCSEDFQSSHSLSAQSDLYCVAIKNAQDCLVAADCAKSKDFILIAFRASLFKLYADHNCTEYESPTNSTVSPTEEPSSEPPVEECTPLLLKLPNNSDLVEIKRLPPPDVTPKESLTNVLCRQHYYPTLRHCSLFSYSHLRSFDETADMVTCSLPGKWYLLNHRDVTIEVTGVTDDINTSFTKLQKVNITLHSFDCTRGSTVNYVATATDDQLPSTFSSDNYFKIKLLDPIDFHISADRTVATILAPWLNLTVVVTKYDEHLGVVVRMPADIIQSSDGLCRNLCPSHSLVETSHVIDEGCHHDKNSAVYGCTVDAEIGSILADSDEQTFSLTRPFLEFCQFDVLHSLSYSALSFMRAIADQYRVLHNVAPLIIPEPFTRYIDPTTTATTTSTTTTSTTSTTTTSTAEPATSSLATTPIKAPPTLSTSDSISATTTSTSNIVTPPTSVPSKIAELPVAAASSSKCLSSNRLIVFSILLLPLFLLYRF